MAEPATRARLAAPALTGARVAEQAALALTLVVLAARLPVADFGVVSLVVAFASLAVTASDHGLGLAVLRSAPGAHLDRRRLDACRRTNGGLLALGAAASVVLGVLDPGRLAWAPLLGAAIWATSSEAYVRKSAALRLGEPVRVARIEVAGSAALLGTVVLAGTGAGAGIVVALAFVLKSAVEVAGLPDVVEATFAPDGEDAPPGWIWTSQLLSFAIANVDYVLVGAVLGARALGLYSLAFRATSLVTSQVSAVVVRVTTVDLAARQGADRAAAIARAVRRLLLAGLAVTVVGLALAAPTVGLLGDRWEDAVPLTVPLLLAVPARLILPVVGVVALVEGRARDLCRVEALRLAALVVVLAIGAGAGLTAFAWTAAAATIALTAWMALASPVRIHLER